jgi:hypothetical protein
VPAFEVKSLAMIATLRPATEPTTVTTASAGTSFSMPASRPSSKSGSPSSSAAMRSRTNIRFSSHLAARGEFLPPARAQACFSFSFS